MKKRIRVCVLVFCLIVCDGQSHVMGNPVQNKLNDLKTKLVTLRSSLVMLKSKLVTLAGRLSLVKKKLFDLTVTIDPSRKPLPHVEPFNISGFSKIQTDQINAEKDLDMGRVIFTPNVEASVGENEPYIKRRQTTWGLLSDEIELEGATPKEGENTTMLTQEKLKNPQAVLPEETLQKLIPGVKREDTDFVKVYAFIKHFADSFVSGANTYVKQPLSKTYTLEMCAGKSCFGFAERILITLLQANEILRQHKNKTDLFVHTTLGAGKLLQVYMLVYLLRKLGYTNIHVNAIDEVSPSEELRPGLKNSFDIVVREDGLGPGIKLVYYRDIGEYLKKRKQNDDDAPEGHSFDMIDIAGGILRGPTLTNSDSLNKDDAPYYTFISVKGQYGGTAPVFEIFLLPGSTYVCRSQDTYNAKLEWKGVLPANSVRKQNGAPVNNEHVTSLVSFAKVLMEKKDVSSIVNHIFSNENELVGHINSTKSTLNVELHNVAWFDFSRLIDQSKAVENPIVFDGIGSEVDWVDCPNHVIHKYIAGRYTGWKDFFAKGKSVIGSSDYTLKLLE